MQFKLKMEDAKFFKDLINAVASLLDEATFRVTQEGLFLRGMDPSHVAMVDLVLPRDLFEEFYCDEEIFFCVPVGSLIRLLKRVKAKETLELSLEESKLFISITGRYNRTFSIMTLEPEKEEIPVPKIQFTVKVKLETEILKSIVEDAALVGTHLTIHAEGDKLSFVGKNELHQSTAELTKDNFLEFEVETESTATFSLTYLSEIVRMASATSEIVEVAFSTDMPLKLVFRPPRGGTITFFLAPRIEVA